MKDNTKLTADYIEFITGMKPIEDLKAILKTKLTPEAKATIETEIANREAATPESILESWKGL